MDDNNIIKVGTFQPPFPPIKLKHKKPFEFIMQDKGYNRICFGNLIDHSKKINECVILFDKEPVHYKKNKHINQTILAIDGDIHKHICFSLLLLFKIKIELVLPDLNSLDYSESEIPLQSSLLRPEQSM